MPGRRVVPRMARRPTIVSAARTPSGRIRRGKSLRTDGANANCTSCNPKPVSSTARRMNFPRRLEIQSGGWRHIATPTAHSPNAHDSHSSALGFSTPMLICSARPSDSALSVRRVADAQAASRSLAASIIGVVLPSERAQTRTRRSIGTRRAAAPRGPHHVARASSHP